MVRIRLFRSGTGRPPQRDLAPSIAKRPNPVQPARGRSGRDLSGAATAAMPSGSHSADRQMMHVAAERWRAGDVLVVAPTVPSDAGYFLELLATSLKARGVRWLVIEAGCRR